MGHAPPVEPAPSDRRREHGGAQSTVLPEPDLRLLILGLSNLVRRRVLPALEGMDRLAAVDIASRRGAPDWQRPAWLPGDTYQDYDEALQRSRRRHRVRLAGQLRARPLVSQPHWSAAATLSSTSPAFLGLEEADGALDLAAKRNVCLAEATVWAYHPQIDLMRRSFAEAGSPPTRVAVTFSVPPLDPGISATADRWAAAACGISGRTLSQSGASSSTSRWR